MSPTDLFQKTQEFRILNIAVKREKYGVSIRMGKIGQRLTLLNALAKDAVKPLTGPFDQTAFAEHFGDTAITRVLLPKDILRGYAWRETTRAHNLNAPRILAHEDRTSIAIVAVTHCVQNGLTNHALVERGYVPNKESLLKVLQVIALVDESPDLVEYRKKTLPKFMTFRCWSRYFIRSVFEYDFRLGEILSQGFARAQQDQRRIRHLAIDEQLRICQKLLYGTGRDVLVRRLSMPQLTQSIHSGRIEIFQSGLRTYLCGKIGASLSKNALELIRRHGNESLATTHPVRTFVVQRHADRTTGNLKYQDPTVWVLNLLNVYAQSQSLNQTGLRPFEIGKSTAANHRTRQRIRYTQNYPSTTFIGEGDTVIHQSLKAKISPCRFELQVLVLPGVHPGFEFG